MGNEEHPSLDHTAILDREFCLRRKGAWSDCPSLEPLSLKIIQDEINDLKVQISTVCTDVDDGLRKWRLHTQNTHPLSMAPRLLRDQHNCYGTSQAYCKFLEILRRYPLIHSRRRQLRSFHLCEAPGHFVTSLDRFLCTFYPKMHWYWEANSLNPHHEGTSACDMLLEDDIILRHPERWRFGNDGSGDIKKWDDDYLKYLAGGRHFDLITADGSLYSQDNPEEQELVTLPLFEAELRIAERLLAFLGSLIVKVYTMYLPETRALIQGIASHFDDVYVFKPMSSKGGNNERYLICLGFRGCETKVLEQEVAENVLHNCEIYFSKLQSSFIKANLLTYNVISKEELGVYRDRVFSEFHRRVLTKFISSPSRKSHLSVQKIDRPWTDMFGKNYVETLRHISDKRSALHHLRKFLQDDFLTEHEEISSTVEVEFAEDELEFLEWDEHRLIEKMVVVICPVNSQITHSLFIPPTLLRGLLYWKSEAIIDLCTFSNCHFNGPSQYATSLDFIGDVTVDAFKMRCDKDWLLVLSGILDGVQRERVRQLEILWSASSVPFVLSRFSASVITMLCVAFFQFQLGEGQKVALFSKPNYSEDIPSSMESYLESLCRLTCEDSLHCFVPSSLLALLHPYLLDFNRRQWRQLLGSENFGIK
ncbi:hypothetical protein RB195_003931 [Necator americanus]|uniref:Cap-specific mRNA (nucleoside-2'-O-)-methyltransferase 2 n=1 Tax=Necator americanus TaxID=51031 RepID=A0ABR1DRC4_NECAM